MTQNSDNIKKTHIPRNQAYILIGAAFVLGFFIATLMTSMQEPPVQKQVLGGNPAGGNIAQDMNINNEMLQHIASEEIRLAKEPGDAKGWGHLGDLYFDTKQYAKAISAYEKSLAIIPNNANILTDLGTMYRANGNPEKAVECYDKALLIDQSHRNARFNLGVALIFDLNKKEEGINTWKTLIAQYPDTKAPDGRLLSEFITEL